MTLLSNAPHPINADLLESAFSEAAAGIVLFAADDQARKNHDLLTHGASWYEASWELQPLAEVLFVAGLALGHAPEKTLLLKMGRLREPSIWYRESLEMDNSIRARGRLLERLEVIGCDLETADQRWEDVGDFVRFMPDREAIA